jgi:potassium efflux system protein
MNRILHRRTRRLVLCFVALMVLPSCVARAQEASPAAATDTQKKAPPPILPIPVEDVSARSEATLTALSALAADEEAMHWLKDAGDEIAADRAAVAARVTVVREALKSDPKVRTLEDLGRMLQALREPFETIDVKLGAKLEKLSKERAQADREAEVWKATLAEAQAAKASEATLRRIRSTQQEIEKLRAAQLARRNKILTLRDQLVAPRSKVDDELKRVRAELDNRLQGVLDSEREPIWSASVRESLIGELDADWEKALAAHWSDARSYAVEHQRGIAVQLAIFIGLALGLRALSARVESRGDSREELATARRVFELPTAMAFVGALAFTWELHPLAPAPFMDVIGALAIIPSALIVRHLLPGTTPMLVGIIIFYFADRVRGLLITLPTLERGLFDLELLGGAVFLVWLIQRRRLGSIPPEMLASRSFRLVGAGIRAAVLLLTLAFLADVVGMGDLSDLIGTATLVSAYYAVFTFAVLRVVQGVVAYLLLVRPLRLIRGISRHRDEVRARVQGLMKVAAWAIYGYVVLGLIGIRTQVLDFVQEVFAAQLSVGALAISLGDVTAFGLTVYLSFRLARLVDYVLNEDVFTRLQLARGVPYAISSLVRYSFIVLGIGVSFAAAGIELSKLTVIAGGLGVGIGFGLQNVVNNWVSGLILLFERPLQVGDAVQLANGLWGEIGHIGIRASVIRTFDGAEVIVPNGSLISEQVTNWTLSDHRRRIELNVGVEYGTPAQRVIDLLLEVAHAHPEVLDDPESAALFMGFGDSSLDFLLRVWIGNFGGGFTVRSELSVAIQAALADAGIGVPFPQRDLHLKTVSDGVAGRLAGAPAPGDPSTREG